MATRTSLSDWMTRLSRELQLDELALDDDDLHTVLDLARDAAHQIERPAAPLTTFLVGVAVGRGRTLAASAATATALALEVEHTRSGGAAPPAE